MTVNEYRKDFYQQGYTIVESGTPDQQGVAMVVFKVDTDNLRFEYRFIAAMTILDKVNNADYVQVLKNCTTVISNKITNRHAQNINNCQHKIVMIGTTKACEYCMGKFGTTISIDMNDN